MFGSDGILRRGCATRRGEHRVQVRAAGRGPGTGEESMVGRTPRVPGDERMLRGGERDASRQRGTPGRAGSAGRSVGPAGGPGAKCAQAPRRGVLVRQEMGPGRKRRGPGPAGNGPLEEGAGSWFGRKWVLQRTGGVLVGVRVEAGENVTQGAHRTTLPVSCDRLRSRRAEQRARRNAKRAPDCPTRVSLKPELRLSLLRQTATACRCGVREGSPRGSSCGSEPTRASLRRVRPGRSIPSRSRW